MDSDSAVDLLKKLKDLPITLEVLQKTRIGMSVNTLRKKSENSDLQTQAKSLIKSWKKLLPGKMSIYLFFVIIKIMKQTNESIDLELLRLSDSTVVSHDNPAYWFVKIVFFTLKIFQILIASIQIACHSSCLISCIT